MNSKTRIFWNSMTSGARQVLTIGVMIVITPMLIRSVGAEDFGLWTLTFSALGLFGLFDLGFASGAIKYAAECKSRNDRDGRNAAVSTLAVVYLALGALALAGTALLAYFYLSVFSIPASQAHKALSLLWIVSLRVCILGLPLSLFRNLLYGEQKINCLNGVQCLTTAGLGLATWLALRWGYGIVAVAWMSVAAFMLEHLSYLFLAFRLIPGLRFSHRLVSYPLFKEVSAFSLYAFTEQVAALILLRADTLLVKFFLPLGAVAIYGVALKIAENLLLFLKQFLNVFNPVLSEAWARGDTAAIRLVLIKSTKFGFSLGIMVWVNGLVFGADAIALWVGPGFSQAATVLNILLPAMVVMISQIAAGMALTLTGHARFTARAACLGTALNVMTSIALAPTLGMVGIALGTLVATVVVDLGLILTKACRTCALSVSDYLRSAILPALLPALCCFLFAWALVTRVAPTDLRILAAEALAGAALFGLIFWLVGLSTNEKKFLLGRVGLSRTPRDLAVESESA